MSRPSAFSPFRSGAWKLRNFSRMQFTSTFGRWVYVLRVEGLTQFSWSFFSTSLSGFAVLGFSVVKILESELGTLIKGAVLLLYIMVFYFQNSEFCFFKTFFLIGERTLLLTL